MRYWLTLLLVALITATSFWAAQRYLYPDVDERLAIVAAGVARLEAQFDSLSHAGREISQSEANQLAASAGQLREDIERIKREQRFRSWLSHGQLFATVIAVVCQLALLRQDLRSRFKNPRAAQSP